MTKISNLSSPDLFFFQAQNAQKFVFGRGSAPDGPHWGSLRRFPRHPSRLGRWIPPHHSPPLRPLELGARFSGPLNTKSWLRQCSHGVGKMVSRESRGYVPQEIYAVFWLCKFPKWCKFASSEGLQKAKERSASGGFAQTWPWVGLGWVGLGWVQNFLFKMGWVGSSSVKYDLMPKSTGKY